MAEARLEKVTRAELNAFAEEVGAEMAQLQQKIYGLAFSLDCALAVLGNGVDVSPRVKEEMDKRIAAQKAEPTP